MRRDNPQATQIIEAVRLAGDRGRVMQVPTPELVAAAATLAKSVVLALNSPPFLANRAQAVDALDRCGKTIGQELRRRSHARRV
jgi:hypothetical protein